MILGLRARVCSAAMLMGLVGAVSGLHGQSVPPGVGSGAGTFDASALRAPTELGGTWLVHAGDDKAYAAQDFDDHGWTPFALKDSLKKVYPGKPEVVWYRLHVKVAPDDADLALLARKISPAYELFVNGTPLITSGHIAPYKAYTNVALRLATIPAQEVRTGSLTIAVRVFVSRTAWSQMNAGFREGTLTIGERHELGEHVWMRVIGLNILYWLNSLLVLGLGLVAIAVFRAQPGQREYFWIFLQAVVQVAAVPWSLTVLFHDVPAQWGLLQLPLNVLNFVFQALMYFAFLRLKPSRWVKIYLAVTSLLVLLSVAGVLFGVVPTFVPGICLAPFLLLLDVVIPVLLVIQFRRGNREAGILLIPALLAGFASYAGLALFFVGLVPKLEKVSGRIYEFLFSSMAGPFLLSLEDVGNLLFYLSLLLIMVLRSNRMSRQQAVFEGELEAAREVQEVILPEGSHDVPGFNVETVYRPAQQVGGDFFQVVPTAGGGLLMVFGDVAGKGLPAAMMVSMLVGTIRTVAEENCAPEYVLRKLNELSTGRSKGRFSTALAAHFRPDGRVLIANAGHLSPYLNGKEVELAGALPLGVMSGAEYETTEVFMIPGARLTFYSDGVVEAQNTAGQLLGFERAGELSTQPAGEIADIATKFGQTDDITIVAITRWEAEALAA